MNITELTTIVTTVGFPIVACGAMGYFVKYIIDKYTNQVDELTQRHEQETDRLAEVIENNTRSITELSTIIRERKE